jgi:ubiquinone/menaquinone biosynthesis C-methylase UbiE
MRAQNRTDILKGKTGFWDFCAPIYDLVQRNMNGKSFAGVVQTVREFTPDGATVLECAAGTGEISIALADKAKSILCTDMSEKMLNVAKRKAKKRGISNMAFDRRSINDTGEKDFGNITFDRRSIYDTGEADNAYDVVIASQVLHLLDSPEKAAIELRRVSRKTVIVAVGLMKGSRSFLTFFAKTWRLFGFAPKHEFDADGFARFLEDIGFEDFRMTVIEGSIPMAVAVWEKCQK